MHRFVGGCKESGRVRAILMCSRHKHRVAEHIAAWSKNLIIVVVVPLQLKFYG